MGAGISEKKHQEASRAEHSINRKEGQKPKAAYMHFVKALLKFLQELNISTCSKDFLLLVLSFNTLKNYRKIQDMLHQSTMMQG